MTPPVITDGTSIGWLVLLPLTAGVMTFLVRRHGAVIALAAAGLNALLVVVLTTQVATVGTVTHQIAGWGTPLGIELRADGLACLMLGLTGVIGIAVSIYATGYFTKDDYQQNYFWPLWMLLWAGLNALFLSSDIFNIYVTLEIVGLSAVALASLSGTAASLNAAMRYLLVSLLGSLVFLAGVSLLYAAHQILDINMLATAVTPGVLSWSAMALMTTGLMMKTALFPLHFWLPPAHANAAAPVSALLSALVIKASFYLLLRLWFELFAGVLSGVTLQLIGFLGSAALLWGSVLACYQRRLKLLVAYSTVAQLGYLFIAFPLVAATGALGYNGAVFFALSHGFAKAAMFLSAGTLMHVAGHDRIDGLAEIAPCMPISLISFGLAGISLMGLPPSGGFIAKWLLLEAALNSGQWWWALIILLGGLLAGVYIYRVVSCAFVGGSSRAPTGVSYQLEWSALAMAIIACGMGLLATTPLELLSTTQSGLIISGTSP